MVAKRNNSRSKRRGRGLTLSLSLSNLVINPPSPPLSVLQLQWYGRGAKNTKMCRQIKKILLLGDGHVGLSMDDVIGIGRLLEVVGGPPPAHNHLSTLRWKGSSSTL